jgi:hypothetical protein
MIDLSGGWNAKIFLSSPEGQRIRHFSSRHTVNPRNDRKRQLRAGGRLKHLAGDFATEAVFLCNVRRPKIVAASALLVIWIPATSLCLAENAGLVADIDHCGDCPSQ